MQKKKKNISAFIFFLIFLVFSIYIITINILEMKRDNVFIESNYDLREMSASAMEILNNVLGNPIESLSPVLETNNCSHGEVKLAIFNLRTTEFWCECPDFIYPGKCNETSPSSCSTHNQAAFEGFKWRGAEICAKRIPFSGWSYPGFASEPICPWEDSYYCQSSRICVMDQYRCPLTNIKIVERSLVDKYLKEGYLSSLIVLNNSLEIITSNQEKNRGIVLELIARDERAGCLSPERRPNEITDDFDIYTPRKVGCGPYGDKSRFQTVIDSYEEAALLRENRFTGEISKNFDFISKVKQVDLLVERKISLNFNEKRCQGINFSDLMQNSYNLAQFTSLRMGSNLVALIFCGMKLVFLMVFFFFNFVASKVHHIIHLTNIIFGFLIVNATTQVILCSLSLIYSGTLKNNISQFNKMARLDCIKLDSSTQVFNDISSYLGNQFEINVYYTKLNLISASICILFCLLMLILWARKRTKYQKIEGEKELLLSY